VLSKRAFIACTSILAACALLAATPSHAGGKTEAQVRFEKGVSLYKAGDNEGALVEFKAAYEAEPNHKVRYNIGMTLFNLHRYVEAKVELQAYLAEGGKDVPADKKTEVQSLLYELDSYIGTLIVTCAAQGAILAMDGIHVGPLPFSEPLSVDVGEHVIAIEAPGYLSWSQKVSVAGGKLVSVEASLTLDAPAQQPDSHTGSSMDAAAEPSVILIFGSACKSDVDCTSSQSCHAGECMSTRQWINLENHGKNLILPGWILFGLGLGLGIPGIILEAINHGDSAGNVAGRVLEATGGASLVTSIVLLAVGYKYRKLAKKKLAFLDSPPLPWIAPMDGGVALGLSATF
jgi:hypothetical protein